MGAQVVEQELGDARMRSEVHGEHGVPVGPVDVADRLRNHDPGSVDQPADGRKLGACRRDSAREVVGVGDVDCETDGVDAECARLGRHRRGAVTVLVPRRDRAPDLGQRNRTRPSDPGSSAGDNDPRVEHCGMVTRLHRSDSDEPTGGYAWWVDSRTASR